MVVRRSSEVILFLFYFFCLFLVMVVRHSGAAELGGIHSQKYSLHGVVSSYRV